jgi:hypothetical protein
VDRERLVGRRLAALIIDHGKRLEEPEAHNPTGCLRDNGDPSRGFAPARAFAVDVIAMVGWSIQEQFGSIERQGVRSAGAGRHHLIDGYLAFLEGLR